MLVTVGNEQAYNAENDVLCTVKQITSTTTDQYCNLRSVLLSLSHLNEWNEHMQKVI